MDTSILEALPHTRPLHSQPTPRPGLTWIKTKEETAKVCRLGQKTLLPNVEHALANGLAIIIENMGLSYDAVLTPVVGRQILRRGRATFVKLGEKEVDYDSKFKLYLQTKLSNPHYPPEIQAETTLINFMVSSIYTHLPLSNHSYATHRHSFTTLLYHSSTTLQLL